MKPLALLVVIGIALAVAASGPSPAARASADANAVTYWSHVTENAVSVGRPPASAQVLAAIVHAAIYDTVAAVEGGLEPFAASTAVEQPADTSAAVATAARRVLRTRVPAQAAGVDGLYAAYMGAITDGAPKSHGVVAGEAVAGAYLALRANDGFDNTVLFLQPPPGPGVWEPAPPSATPVDVKLKQVRPFTFDDPSEFRPNGPLDLDSGRYAADLAEVEAYGRSDSTVRTQEQTEIARFWAENSFVQWSRIVRGLADSRGFGLRESAQLLGLVHVAAADTMIACFDAKYYFNFWRPVHAIQRADIDGNARTEPDTTWTPFLVVNHPEYPSGHACFTGAVTEALRAYFGTDRLPLTIDSTVTGTARSYARLSDILAEVEDARVWSGLHFRTTMVEGAKLARKIVSHVVAHSFRRAQ
jgi:VCPO second helical-bundle domain